MERTKAENLSQLLETEGDAAEQGYDFEPRSDTKITRGHGRSRTLQVRLNDDEYEALETLAGERGLPVSTMVRSVLLDRLQGSGVSSAPLIDRADLHEVAIQLANEVRRVVDAGAASLKR